MCVFVCVCVYVCVCVCLCLCVYVKIYMYFNIYIYTYFTTHKQELYYLLEQNALHVSIKYPLLQSALKISVRVIERAALERAAESLFELL